MFTYLKQNKVLLCFTIVCSMISSLGCVLIAIILQKIMDIVMIGDMHAFINMLLLSVCYVLGLGIFLFLQSLFTKKIVCKITYTLRNDMFQGILKQSMGDFTKQQTADYLSAIQNDVKMIEDNYLVPFFEILQYVVIFLGSLSVMIYFDVIVTICVVIAILCMLIIPSLFGTMMEKHQHRYSEHLSIFMNNVKDALSGFEVLKAYTMMSYITTRYQKQNQKLMNVKYQVDTWMSVNEGVSMTLSFAIQIFVVLLSAYFIMIGRIQAGALLGLIQASSNLANPLLLIFSNIPKVKSVEPIMKKITGYITYENTVFSGRRTPTFEKEIVFDHVYFSYQDNQPVLQDICLSIQPGKKYALVGKSGCGKSTLIKLLAGYYVDYTGTISYDQQALSTLDCTKVSALSSIIHQNVYMFDESIENNICLHEIYAKEAMQEAIESSGLHDFLEQIEGGLSYLLQENGANLSGGQKQRIAVARALIRQKPLLILDEGTSAIDMQTANDIEGRLLKKESLTLITITHAMKPELLGCYDQIIYMENGCIIEMDSFHNLMKKQDKFYKFFQGRKEM